MSTGSELKAKYTAPEKLSKRKKHIKADRQIFESISSGQLVSLTTCEEEK
jgi:hypothetical protein